MTETENTKTMDKSTLKSAVWAKATSQLTMIEFKIAELQRETPYMALTQDMIDNQIRFQRQELAIWTEIMRLNELDT